VTVTERDYAGPTDLVRIGRLISDTWLTARPNVPFTIVTLEWLMANQPAETDWSRRIRLWEAGDELVGVAWYWPTGNTDGLVRADHDDDALWDRVYAWQEELAAGAGGGPEPLSRFAIDGPTAERSRLERHGFAPTDLALTQWHQVLDGPPAEPVLPPGYRVRTMIGPEDLPARVEVHRAAFAPSQMTAERYARAMASPHYRLDLDVVVEAADGTLAAFALAWFDPDAQVGEFEPVGTHPDHRRRGLALAALRHGLGLLHDAGARDVIVFSETANDASEALYAAAGFRQLATHRRWARGA
jgi:ribosomal protein S18 acetylase RimI-like enzyme